MLDKKPLKGSISETLKKVGKKNQSMKPSTTKYTCEICGNKLTYDDWVNSDGKCCLKCVPERDRRRREKWKTYLKNNMEKELRKRNVPPKYLKCSFDNFIASTQKSMQLKAKIEKYAQKVESSLFITGGCGSGKTHLATACLRETLNQGIKQSFYIKVPELLMEIRHTFDRENTNKENEQYFIERFSHYNFLILDDMGAEKVSEYSIQVLYLLVDKRDSFLKPTMICSNLSIAGLEDMLSPRITSRIVGMGRVIKNPMPDYRMRGKNELLGHIE